MVTENINPPPAATPEPIRSRSVCVIGAGSAGLVAARELRREGHDVVVLEQNHDVGGQWLYEPNVAGEDPLGRNPGNFQRVHSSMYQCLRLQSPREVMGYSDFPFLVKKGRDMRRFPGHRELWLYLGDFAEWFGLREMVRFNTRVEYVGMVEDCVDGAVINGDDLRWLVKSVDKKNGVVKEQVFDAVVVATGHYSQPRLPSIKGMDTWKRKQLHSHIYRVPDPFLNEVVVVVGSSYSGQDISRELTRAAREVHMSARSFGPFTPSLSSALAKHPNLHLHPQIESLEEDGTVHFDDGSCVTADTIIHCTGYSYSFPFLDTKGIVVVDDDRVGPLYEHTFPPSLAPSLSFVGIPRKILGFPFFESQAKWIAQLLSGKRTLPSYNEMMKSIKEFYSSLDAAGVPKYNTHDIASFEYCDRYGDNSGYPHVEEWRKELTISAVKKSIEDWETFRDSWSEEDEKLLQEAFRSPHFTQLGLEVLAFQS